jgi:hypothetical protein
MFLLFPKSIITDGLFFLGRVEHENGIHQFTTDVTEKEHELPKQKHVYAMKAKQENDVYHTL